MLISISAARESLVSDIPAVDGKIDNLFLQCTHLVLSDPPPHPLRDTIRKHYHAFLPPPTPPVR
jgi:hypothetical protein